MYKPRKQSMGTAGFMISLLALTLVLTSGTAYAAVMIGTRNIKNLAVTSPKLANSSVNGAKVKDGSLSLADFTAADQARILGPKAADAVRVEVPDVTVAANDFATFTVWCPGDRKVIGGGFFASIAVPSLSAPNDARTGWVVQINNYDNAIDVTANGWAICS